ncbi:MAG: hypothetical protein IPJ00_18560 [Saprospirales bacterium]|nr:hypothetical protein [Saprospirales bacterium]
MVFGWFGAWGGFELAVRRRAPIPFSVTNLGNGCLSSNTVQVAIDTISPAADAGLGGTINCVVPQIALGGPGTSTGPEFGYAWTLGGSLISTDINLLVSFRELYFECYQ